MLKRKFFIVLAIIITISLIGISAQCGIGVNRGDPTIELGIYYGPDYSESDNMCYYRVVANATGTPNLEIEFNEDNNVKSLSSGTVEVGVKAGETYLLAATATNRQGTASASIILKGECKEEVVAKTDAGNGIDSDTDATQRIKELPIIKKAPIFELINQDNEKVSLNQFPEKVKVLSFFYADCTAEDGCSITTNNFQRLQGLLGEELAKKTVLFLITVNPENDVPEILKEYGELLKVDFSNFHFLTGDKQAVKKVLDDYEIMAEKQELEDEGQISDAGFLTPVVALSGINLIHGDGSFDIRHTLLTLLIDQSNNVRQLYYSNFWEPVDIKKDIITLLNE